MVKAIIFDFHDTFIRNGLNFVLKKGQVLDPAIWKPFWRDEMTEEQFWRRTAVDFGKDDSWIMKSKAIIYSKSVPVRGVLYLVKQLKRKYKLGLLANAPRSWFDDAVLRFNLDKIFNVLVSSGETGLLKPNKEIYLLTCQRLGVLPQECLYIDDDEIKLQAAKNLGMKVILFKNPKQLAIELKK